MVRYRRNAGATFSLKYHLVWCPKYRRPVLTSPYDVRLKEIITEVASEADIIVHALEIRPDHVHLFVEADPTLSVTAIVNRFKGRSSRLMRTEVPRCVRASQRCGAAATTRDQSGTLAPGPS